jgi:hypothetical protein
VRARSCPPWALRLGKAGSFWLNPFEGGSTFASGRGPRRSARNGLSACRRQ